MGCDIHSYIEVKNPNTNNWEFLSLYKKTDDGFKPVEFFEGRNYTLFGMLAGVRSVGVDPITPLRGLPEDLSEEVQALYNEGEGYFHSKTWYDYAELRAAAGFGQDVTKFVLKEALDFLVNNFEPEGTSDTQEYIIEGLREHQDNMEHLSSFVADIERVLDGYQIYDTDPGRIRIVMWFDN